MDFKETAQNIIDLSGGKDNFKSVINCMTRVRIKYKDESKVNKSTIEDLPEVLGIKEAETFQIVVGPGKSNKLQEALNTELGLSSTNEDSSPEEDAGFLKMLSNIFVPIIPAIIASGFLQGINSVITNIATGEAQTQGVEAAVILENWNLLQVSTILGILGEAALAFLAIYVGITAARVFKTDMILGGLVGAITLSGSLSEIGLTAGQGGLMGVILGVWILSKIDKFLSKIIPDIVDVVFRPTLGLLITGLIYFVAIMPVTGILSDALLDGILWLLENTGIIGGFIFAALAPTMISTGLYHGLAPINIELINSTGGTAVNAIQIMSNSGLVGAGVGLYLLTKREEIKEAARGVLPTTFLAVGEPTMFGLVIPSGFGFVTASLGAGVGGALIQLFNVRLAALGAAGMSAIPLVADGQYIQYLISYAGGFTAALALTLVVGKYIKYE